MNTADQHLELTIYSGNIYEQMPRLLADGRVPMTPRQLMYERVHGNVLRNNHVDTACAIITDFSGEVLIGLYADPRVKELIHSISSHSWLENGSLQVSAGKYHEISKDAFVIPAGVARDFHGNCYAHQNMREAFWKYVAEGDANLVRDYLSLVQERGGGSMANRMGLWVSNSPGLRLVCAGSVGGYGGKAVGFNLLDSGYGGRLVGVAPEAPRAFGPLATYRDAPCDASQQVRGKKSKTLWDIIRGK